MCWIDIQTTCVWIASIGDKGCQKEKEEKEVSVWHCHQVEQQECFQVCLQIVWVLLYILWLWQRNRKGQKATGCNSATACILLNTLLNNCTALFQWGLCVYFASLPPCRILPGHSMPIFQYLYSSWENGRKWSRFILGLKSQNRKCRLELLNTSYLSSYWEDRLLVA